MNPNVLYLSEADDIDEIYMLSKSTDGGAHWTSTWQFEITTLTFDPTNPDTLYAGTGDVYHQVPGASNLLKSPDGGNSWNPIGFDGLRNYIRDRSHQSRHSLLWNGG